MIKKTIEDEASLFLSYDAFLRSFKRNVDTPHSFFLGAGASITSGIQSAYDCIWEWKKDIYLSKHLNTSEFYKSHKNESVRSSIQKWLDNEGVYPALDSSEEYSFYAQMAYPIADDRRKYFQSLFENKEPYIGYKALCLLAKNDIIKSVWTTNFDGLTVRTAFQSNLTPIEITLDNVDRLFRNQSKKELLSIALHGDYKYSTLKNTEKELDSQDGTFSKHLGNYHVDKNLIVIGYSGRDKSLMKSLNDAFTKQGAGRLYWCGYGEKINKEIEELIRNVRTTGREAFYISTDGFDKTLIDLSKSALEDNSISLASLNSILKLANNEELSKIEFSQSITRTDKYLKSNLHAIVFPKELFQFEVEFGDNKPWSFLKDKTNNTDICAIPFKRKVYALGTLSGISSVFKNVLKSEIRRVPISKFDIDNVSSFRSLMIQTVIKHFLSYGIFDSNLKDKLWLRNSDNSFGDKKTHKAIYLSFYFDKSSKFGYMSFSPSIHITSENEISKEEKQRISKEILEKLRNDKFDEILEYWNTILFNYKNLKFEYPLNSGTGFEFQISRNTAFAEIMVLDPNYRVYKPSDYNNKLTQFRGVQYLEPQLIFQNSLSNSHTKDYHPMRALTNNRPYDNNLNGIIYSNEVNLAVICGKNYSKKMFDFLNQLNLKHPTDNINPDFLIEYPGFASAYNLPINIPYYEDTDKWINIELEKSNKSDSEYAIIVARLITSKIEQIINIQSQHTIVIFIPKEWQAFETFQENGETFDLHDYIKAFSASKGVSTQLIREETLDDRLKCQVYWWLSLSFYVKSLRTPWILNNQEKNTAYAGIGYSIKKNSNDSEVVIGCSHIYDSNGQGLKYKLSKVDNYFLDKQSNPFMSYNDAFQFGVSIRELFYNSLDRLPERVVIHKRTKFTDDEIKGITASLNMAGITKIDLIEINYETEARFLSMNVFNSLLSIDKFPISRGTCIVTNKYEALLWTHGIVPSVRNPNYRYYLGGRSIPAPIKITRHYGESDLNTIAIEILGLTKMNWNSFDLYSKLPATINSSNQIARIGKLLARFEGKTYDYRLFI
ncbi:SIR2 family protein [Flavobacterium sp. EDS]|uniref:SIR2 family protein n=1 Tax=Flavobacterium sp. EDS TaxID=2897328 RepID=UPI001E5E480D|nr:SIR2 family protein [Flavobacterium sp. EDS]MCD0474009.1 SIR2 family protein [Flavobacterium sp. EDS]